VPERYHAVTLFGDALLSIGHAHIFPRPRPDYYPLWISDFTAAEVWDLTASSAVNLPTISARLRLVVNYVAGVSSLALVGKTALLRTEYSGFSPMPQGAEEGRTNQQPARRLGAN
jgi:hypothetical protein